MSRPRPAPRAVRTPSSRRRAVARERKSPAMFTHVARSTTSARAHDEPEHRTGAADDRFVQRRGQKHAGVLDVRITRVNTRTQTASSERHCSSETSGRRRTTERHARDRAYCAFFIAPATLNGEKHVRVERRSDEPLGQHADDRECPAVELDLPADDAAIPAEHMLPDLIRHDQRGWRALHEVLRAKDAADDRLNAEDVEEVRRDGYRLPGVDDVIVGVRHAHVVAEDRDAGDRSALCRELRQLDDRELVVVAVGRGGRRVQAIQLFRRSEGQRRDEHASNDGKDGGVRANAEREREQDDGGEDGCAPQAAQRDQQIRARVLPQMDWRCSASICMSISSQ